MAKLLIVTAIGRTVRARTETVMAPENFQGKTPDCHGNRSNCKGSDGNCHGPRKLSGQNSRLSRQSVELLGPGRKL
ncbi:hypothetical protein MKY41_18815 [Sporosarcina sp. FSL W7-1349]|uniref:hypothetical protein n=1 Tax=Sporosarcina sp. FSL W7-1349 TaxID=2921561 RepID=UPI0030FC97ED